MATIREVVEALSRGPGVDAVVVVGRDGLPIQSHARNGVDPENLAALLPSVINGMTQLGAAAGRGECGTGLLESGGARAAQGLPPSGRCSSPRSPPPGRLRLGPAA